MLIHPSIIFHISKARSWWQQAKQSIPDSLLNGYTFLFPMGCSKMFPGDIRNIIFPLGSGSILRFHPSWLWQEYRQKDARYPNHLNWFFLDSEEEWLSTEIPLHV